MGRRTSRRYMACESLEGAIDAARGLNKQGCVARMGVLGESTEDRTDAVEKREQYRRVVETIVENCLQSGICVKLTALGLDEGLCRSNRQEVILYAGERGRFLRWDMKSSRHTARTTRIVPGMHERHGNTGAFVHANLGRS